MKGKYHIIVQTSGLIDGKRIIDILSHTEDFAESSEYFSWEQYYTKLLVQETNDTYLRYSKHKLNDVYLHEKEKEALLKVIDIIRPLMITTLEAKAL